LGAESELPFSCPQVLAGMIVPNKDRAIKRRTVPGLCLALAIRSSVRC
jgi:hypothetical protein